MAETYDNTENKRIWPPIIIPRGILQKVSDMRHGGNTKKGLNEITARFKESDAALLAVIVEETEAAYPGWKEADDKAKAAVPPPPAKQTAAEKKAAKAAEAGTPVAEPVAATTEVIEE